MSGNPENLNSEMLKAMAPRLRHELNRFQMGDRERTLAQLILMLSWDEGLPSVRISTHEDFHRLLGIAVTHISTILTKLKRKRILTVTEKDGETFYTINADATNWQAGSRADWPDVLKVWNEVRELNGLPRLVEAELNFRVRQSAIFLGQSLTTLEGVNVRIVPTQTHSVQPASVQLVA